MRGHEQDLALVAGPVPDRTERPVSGWLGGDRSFSRLRDETTVNAPGLAESAGIRVPAENVPPTGIAGGIQRGFRRLSSGR